MNNVTLHLGGSSCCKGNHRYIRIDRVIISRRRRYSGRKSCPHSKYSVSFICKMRSFRSAKTPGSLFVSVSGATYSILVRPLNGVIDITSRISFCWAWVRKFLPHRPGCWLRTRSTWFSSSAISGLTIMATPSLIIAGSWAKAFTSAGWFITNVSLHHSISFW